ncbi:hypothetical protein [Streptomyces sp. NPDC048442]|uniref:hypothetical protein n=1 Tax=Streptomyces sp. NPDC048442 TaxID=3154823 RepID=UPI0034241077
MTGTPAHMAPEALSGTSDPYSLGCVLDELVTGRRIFTGAFSHLINQHLHEQSTPLASCRWPGAPQVA